MRVPCHIGIDGNEQVDAIAKLAAHLQPEYIKINYTHWCSTQWEKTIFVWDNEWQQYNGKLKHIKEDPSPWAKRSIPRLCEVTNQLR